MTVDDLIVALLELTEHDPTVGGWVVDATWHVHDEWGDVAYDDSSNVVSVERRQNASGPWVQLVTE